MNQLMVEAANLMLVGMGFVFLFLTLLVGVTSLLSRVVAWMEPPVPVPTAEITPHGSSPAAPGDNEVIVAISTAIKKYRSRHKP